MNFQIITIALAALFLNACIAGPTPHPAGPPGDDPNTSNSLDTSMGGAYDDEDNGEASTPSADAVGSVDGTSGDALSDDADDPDGSGEDSSAVEDSSSSDSIQAGDVG